MKIERIGINELIEYEANAKQHPKKQIEQICESIRQFGNNDPIAVDENNVIIEGHGRLYALKKLGYTEVEVIRLTHLTEEQKRAYILAHNKLTMNTDFDMRLLQEELDKITEIRMVDLGFDELEAVKLKEDEFEIEVDEAVEPNTKPGDLFQLGEHRLLCGDSTSKKDVDRLMNGEKADLIITDPPYNVNYEGTAGKIKNDNMSDEKFYSFLLDAYTRMYENSKSGAAIYVFHADTYGEYFRRSMQEAGFKLAECLIWVKNSLVLGRQDYHWRHEPILYGWKEGAAHNFYGKRAQDTVIDETIDYSKMKKEELLQAVNDLKEQLLQNNSIVYFKKPLSSKEHPTMKPVELVGKFMKNSSKRGNLLYEPFGGSGSTMIASEQLGRKCYTMELDPKFCDVIIKRWEDYTGDKAIKL